jgi:hypothetical protein
MTGEEVKALSSSLDDLTAALIDRNSVDAKIDRLLIQSSASGAMLDALKRSSETQLATLFDYHREHGQRIAKIEAEYTPRDACDRKHDGNAEDHAQYSRDIGALNVSVGKLMMIAGGVSGAVSGAIQLTIWVLSKGHT